MPVFSVLVANVAQPKWLGNEEQKAYAVVGDGPRRHQLGVVRAHPASHQDLGRDEFSPANPLNGIVTEPTGYPGAEGHVPAPLDSW